MRRAGKGVWVSAPQKDIPGTLTRKMTHRFLFTGKATLLFLDKVEENLRIRPTGPCDEPDMDFRKDGNRN